MDRTTTFETGFQGHEALRDRQWAPDPLILDDQALVIRLRDRGLVVLSGCGHAGIINTVRYARRLTGTDEVAAVIGGFHVSGPTFEPIIDPTVEAFAELAPSLLMPAHCTGWKAVHRLASRLPDAFVQATRFATHGGLVPPRVDRKKLALAHSGGAARSAGAGANVAAVAAPSRSLAPRCRRGRRR